MLGNRSLWTGIVAGLALAGCASRPKEVAVAPPAPPVLTPQPMPQAPPGTGAGLAVPPRLADGRYATPNTGLTPPAALWHVRTALNVAALGCRGTDEATVIAGYNGWLKTAGTALAAAHKSLVAAQGAAGFDDAMTRLYNYWAHPGAHDAFCAAAAGVIVRSASVTPATAEAFAVGAIADLDRPFVDLFGAYDAYRVALAQWQANRMAVALHPVAPHTVVATAASPAAPGTTPDIGYDPAIFTMP
ncbi:hypothetical protein ACFO8O_09150 [Hephaestia sp. GCM10023244]|uniref:hypothetical protein n=1 Tax=unclassified Hephaestia TaxID=2631281 RepID=UPI002076E776|nr:hypothetical protein [Hephaestia sp. MAHUQ-44]MCM8731124.1 hypothetical protein [Hephaestia sp. MAHUQ-44]